MPEVQIQIGGRPFNVACQEGEEHFLQAAAGLLDNEARTLMDQIGRLPEARMLLMAGLILYQTGEIVNGGEDNYILATVTLYVSVFNLFTSLLHLLGFAGEE